jgi:peptide/nickel transport system substrate-binding protein
MFAVRANRWKILLGVALVAGVAAALATTVAAKPSKHSTSLAGGTYRVGWESSFGFTGGFDPTGEYLGEAFAVLSSLMVRTLVGYNHVEGAAGNAVVPDLATSLPEPTNGGKTYTFQLKPGIKFGPPVSRPVTSQDIKYAFERLANPKNAPQYAFYYTPIKGFADVGAGKAKTISGIATPNPRTVVFNLTKPVGDFLLRLSMPATGPIPAEVGKCFDGKPLLYGRNLVSTAGYMFEGSDQVDASSCTTLKPASGFDGETKMILVRNPDYDPKTDSKAARENLPDRFEFTVNSNADDIYNKVKAGDLENENATEPPKVVREYLTNPSLKPMFHSFPGDRTWYVPMTTTQPPFDDVHVRRAMNWVVDRDAMRRAWGGPTVGQIANHMVPDTLFNFQLQNYHPFKTPGDHGSVAKAKAEIKQSKYDTNKDGICDAKACKNVIIVTDTRSVDPGTTLAITSSAAKIGITFKVRQIKGAYPTIQTPKNNIPISERPGWGKDFADAETFFEPLLRSTVIIPSGNTNYSLIGLTPAIAKKIGAKGSINNVPSLDKDMDRCQVLSGTARRICWQDVDKKFTYDIAAWIPWLWSNATYVTGPKSAKANGDQFSGSIGWAHVAVKQ